MNELVFVLFDGAKLLQIFLFAKHLLMLYNMFLGTSPRAGRSFFSHGWHGFHGFGEPWAAHDGQQTTDGGFQTTDYGQQTTDQPGRWASGLNVVVHIIIYRQRTTDKGQRTTDNRRWRLCGGGGGCWLCFDVFCDFGVEDAELVAELSELFFFCPCFFC